METRTLGQTDLNVHPPRLRRRPYRLRGRDPGPERPAAQRPPRHGGELRRHGRLLPRQRRADRQGDRRPAGGVRPRLQVRARHRRRYRQGVVGRGHRPQHRSVPGAPADRPHRPGTAPQLLDGGAGRGRGGGGCAAGEGGGQGALRPATAATGRAALHAIDMGIFSTLQTSYNVVDQEARRGSPAGGAGGRHGGHRQAPPGQRRLQGRGVALQLRRCLLGAGQEHGGPRGRAFRRRRDRAPVLSLPRVGGHRHRRHVPHRERREEHGDHRPGRSARGGGHVLLRAIRPGPAATGRRRCDGAPRARMRRGPGSPWPTE